MADVKQPAETRRANPDKAREAQPLLQRLRRVEADLKEERERLRSACGLVRLQSRRLLAEEHGGRGSDVGMRLSELAPGAVGALGAPSGMEDWITVGDALASEGSPDNPVVAATLHGEVVSLQHSITSKECAFVKPVLLRSTEGLAVYRQSLCFLCSMAAMDCFPDKGPLRVVCCGNMDLVSSLPHCRWHVRLAKGRVLCAYRPVADFLQFADEKCPVTTEVARSIEDRMRAYVKADVLFTEEKMRVRNALAYFESADLSYVSSYLQSRSQPTLKVIRAEAVGPVSPLAAGLGGGRGECMTYRAMSHSFRGRVVAPSASFLSRFRLEPCHTGLSLSFPTMNPDDTHLPTPEACPLVMQCYDRTNQWASVMDVGCVGDLNRHIEAGTWRSKELVHICEAQQIARIVDVAHDIHTREGGRTKLVLVAGPSTSGKTTFAAKLKLQLTVHGRRPVMFSTDNYYRDRTAADYPRTPSGELDHEHIDALDLSLLHKHLKALLAGQEIDSPVFDFLTQSRRSATHKVKLPPKGILIAEGIFCLHPQLSGSLPDQDVYRVFACPMTQLNVDEQHFLSHQMLRLVRRVCRDNMSRGRGAKATIARLPAVVRGEERNIYPYLHKADALVNTALDYELSVLKVFAQPLLELVKPSDPEYGLAHQVAGLLQMVHPIPAQFVPSSSIVREFIGGSDFDDE